jgi:hypothetical protein
VELQKEIYERSPKRMAEKKKIFARMRYASQQAGLTDLPDLSEVDLTALHPELSASPSRRYSQELTFFYNRS